MIGHCSTIFMYGDEVVTCTPSLVRNDISSTYLTSLLQLYGAGRSEGHQKARLCL